MYSSADNSGNISLEGIAYLRRVRAYVPLLKYRIILFVTRYAKARQDPILILYSSEEQIITLLNIIFLLDFTRNTQLFLRYFFVVSERNFKQEFALFFSVFFFLINHRCHEGRVREDCVQTTGKIRLLPHLCHRSDLLAESLKSKNLI